MSLIAVVGNLTLDIINRVAQYPAEDDEVKAESQRITSGGNAANTALVLAQHRHKVEWLGCLADDHSAQWLEHHLQAHGVLTASAVHLQGQTPTSYIIESAKTGSRTIVHHRDLPELTVDAFQTLAFPRYDWLHFEGRNLAVIHSVLESLQDRYDQVVSVEIEKPREGIEALIQWVDIVFLSKPYAIAKGYSDATALLNQLHTHYPDKLFTCTWGEEGAYAIAADGRVLHATQAVRTVKDTIGAGDCFNAGMIHSLCTGRTVVEALQYATQLAACKIEQEGLLNLALCKIA